MNANQLVSSMLLVANKHIGPKFDSETRTKIAGSIVKEMLSAAHKGTKSKSALVNNFYSRQANSIIKSLQQGEAVPDSNPSYVHAPIPNAKNVPVQKSDPEKYNECVKRVSAEYPDLDSDSVSRVCDIAIKGETGDKSAKLGIKSTDRHSCVSELVGRGLAPQIASKKCGDIFDNEDKQETNEGPESDKEDEQEGGEPAKQAIRSDGKRYYKQASIEKQPWQIINEFKERGGYDSKSKTKSASSRNGAVDQILTSSFLNEKIRGNVVRDDYVEKKNIKSAAGSGNAWLKTYNHTLSKVKGLE
jgi:hypothetical protein